MPETGKTKPARPPRPLPPNQRRFVEEYLVDLNATQAAMRAGYSPKTADRQGFRLLRNAEVAAAISAAKTERAKRIDITADRVLKELSLLAFSDHTHYAVDASGNVTLAENAPPGAHRAVSSIKHRITTDAEGRVTRNVELKFWDKPGPLRLAGRHVGLFPDRVEVTGKDGAPIEIEQVTREAAIAALRAVTGKKAG